MKKTIYTFAMIMLLNAMSLINAQLIKNDFMDGLQINDPVEKGVYLTGDESIMKNQWNLFDQELISGWPPAPGNSPLTVSPLTYSGYIDSGKGNAMKLEKITGGGRRTVYSLDDGDSYKLASYYITFLINVDKNTTSDRIGVLGFSGSPSGGFIRGVLTVTNFMPGTSYKLGISDINGGGSLLPTVCKYGETYLVVLKYDLNEQVISCFINPSIAVTEPTPTGQITKRDSFSALNYIRGIAIFQREDFSATLGSFRFAESWEGAVLLSTNINEIPANYGKIIKERYFNLLGVEVFVPHENNIYIKASTYENGKTVNQKINYTRK